MKTKLAIIIGMSVCASFNAQAAIISGYGTDASSSTASNCPSFCTTSGGGDFQYDFDGAEFQTSASSAESSYATTRAYASLSGATYLPTLKVDASADESRRGSSTAFAAQGYTYSGAATTITLDFNLHGSVGDNPAGYTNNNLRADIAVMIGNELEWFPDFSTLVYEVSTLPVVGNESLFINDGIDIDVFSSITFDIEDGQDFFVIASMGATAQNGYADAWNTLTMTFADDTGLTAASAVPVPAAVWLFGSGLLGLFGIARKKAHA